MEKVGKYELREELGRGGMGIVYRAYDTVLDREVALKLILDSAMNVPEIRERFYREARTAGKLTHDNITIIHDVGEDQGRLYIVMEYLPGYDLRTILDRKAPLPLYQKLDLAVQIARGLAYSHSRNIIHRDIKPANIRVVDDRKVKIMDFGIAKLEASATTSAGTVVGTPFYMSPEQIQGKHVDKRSDIFAFGVLLYELLTYHKPFTGSDPTSVMYTIVHGDPEHHELLERTAPVALTRTVNRILQKNPDHRFQSFTDIVNALEEVMNDLRHAAQVTPEDRRKAFQFLAKARDLFAHQNFSGAKKSAEEAAAFDPGNSQVLLLLDEIHQAQQIETTRVALEQHVATARRLFNARRFAEAMQAASEVLSLDPQNPEGLRLLASARERHAAHLFREAQNQQRRGESGAAQRAARKALDLSPSHKGAEQLLKSLEGESTPAPRSDDADRRRPAPAPEPSPERPAPLRDPARRRNRSRWIAAIMFLLLAAGGAGAWRLFWYVSPPSSGYVALNILPWAEVRTVTRSDGSRVPLSGSVLTPCRIELAPGMYEIEVANSTLRSSLVLRVTVGAGTVEELSQKLPGFDYESYLSTL